MTSEEFKMEMQKLEDVYPQHFANQHKFKIIRAFVIDLPHSWWSALVNRIILSSNPFLDIDDAARGERLASKKAQNTAAFLRLEDEAHAKIGDALSPLLSENKASSLWDLVKQSKESK